MAFHDDLHALARHARTSSDPNVRAAAQRILTGDHALLPEPARVDWAVAWTYRDGEVRTREVDDEQEARDDASRTNAEAAARDPGDSMPVRAYAVFREVRMLVDGTQIIGPWLAPADQFTEGRQ
ncbi:hypothetical protein QQG74_09390 [Micromonospora sp. FIMYZ51]|uniref:hypothetical protein n=1 Tax=Micromonospora sp. FIMYZ51 TaxID=3051832 RepID=UPI00311E7A11